MEWIPIKEDDPPFEKKVVVLTIDKHVFVGSFNGDEWNVRGFFKLPPEHKDFPITHWSDCIPQVI